MTGDGIHTGGCLCGVVRFSVKGASLRAGLCHCQDCRRVSGSAFNFFGVWSRYDYEGAGELRTFEGRSFCSVCGSRVASLRDDEAEITLGALDLAPSDIIPGFGRREPWLMNLPWAEQNQHDREPRTIDAPPIEPDIPVPAQQPET